MVGPVPVDVTVLPGEDPDRDRVASLVDPSPVIDPVGVEARVPRAAVPSPDRDRYPSIITCDLPRHLLPLEIQIQTKTLSRGPQEMK